ncbi:protein of unknown function [uncultured Woeseiaceae bacterium]|uniref:Glutamine amidotransferase type-2 domain-containing protein n=1 Tax=uncultured Woeseiaceae bacterium TaxID=1983305 RepID=A0A7D9D2F8_9GAMM|nr:protein of unknown function [uncultured Woeseiaceae bacterium]
MSKHSSTGLYDPSFERDSCGFGLIANIDDIASHWVVETAIGALARLTHRGAVADDGKTGDGCGLLIKFPDSFLRAVGTELGMQLQDRFAAGTVFLSQDENLAERVRNEIDAGINSSGLEVAGWRVVPVHSEVCGELALKTLPRIEQVFVNAPAGRAQLASAVLTGGTSRTCQAQCARSPTAGKKASTFSLTSNHLRLSLQNR